ncbi:MAG: hypothetical protein C4K49_10930 [Candidatus Thorarchaeota archaeon]|nr:MAG: hypothetical protein C4K49_10930 [Candidatus Thorarchaeota archaeon]
MPLDVSKIRYVSLIRLEGGESILNIPYAEMTVDPDLIAGFVTAVIIFAKTPIRTIRKAAYDILIEVGETVLVLLVVDPVPDEAPYREPLKRILGRVELELGDKIKAFEGDIRRFREFALPILEEFPFYDADINLVPMRRKDGIPVPFRVGTIDSRLEKLEAFTSGKRTIGEIMDLIGLPEVEVRALVSILYKYRWIDFRKRLTESDRLVRRECSRQVLQKLLLDYGDDVEYLLSAFDGMKQVRDVLGSLQQYDKGAIWFLINKLVEVGCLSVVTGA